MNAESHHPSVDARRRSRCLVALIPFPLLAALSVASAFAMPVDDDGLRGGVQGAGAVASPAAAPSPAVPPDTSLAADPGSGDAVWIAVIAVLLVAIAVAALAHHRAALRRARRLPVSDTLDVPLERSTT